MRPPAPILLPVLLAWVLWPAPAAGQGEGAVRSAQEHVQLGTAFFKRGHYAQALTEFRQANQLVPHPDSLYSMARCLEEMGRAADAVEHFTKYLEQGGNEAKRNKAREAVLRLVPLAFGSVEITCDPPGATVVLQTAGQGPCPFRKERVRVGTWLLRVSAPGRIPVEHGLPVVAGRLATAIIRLPEVPGLLKVESTPAGARVLLDGRDLGTTPVEGVAVALGSHEVRLELDGYRPWVERVEVVIGEAAEVAAFLERRTAGLTVTSEPAGATVRVDDKPAGETPTSRLEVLPGTYDVDVDAWLHAPWHKRVDVRSDQSLELHAELPSRHLAWVLSAAAVLTAAGAAGSYAWAASENDSLVALERDYDATRDRETARTLGDRIRSTEEAADNGLHFSRILLGTAAALAAGGLTAFLVVRPVEETGAGVRGVW